jgi:hypothetical protein
MDARALARSDWARLALWIVALAAADHWLDISIFVSVPAAFLGVLVYGYFAKERSPRRKAGLMAAAAAAWDDVEAAALRLQEAALKRAADRHGERNSFGHPEMFAAGAGRIVSARYQQALVGPTKEFL